jgi:hypothetical protein
MVAKCPPAKLLIVCCDRAFTNAAGPGLCPVMIQAAALDPTLGRVANL